MQISNLLIADSLDRAIKHYGLEGTEEAINRAYSSMPEIKSLLLKNLKERIQK